MSSGTAQRCVRTFQARCVASEEFCLRAEELAKRNLGYTKEVQQAVSTAVQVARKGRRMKVITSDGQELGTLVRVFRGSEASQVFQRCADETYMDATYLEVGRGSANAPLYTLYIPYRAIADILDSTLILNVDAKTACSSGWGQKPC